MMTIRSVLVLAWLLVGCGSSAVPASPADAGAEAGTPASDGRAAFDLSAGADREPDLGGFDGTTGGDAAIATAVRFVLRNETGQTIYLQDNAFWTLWRSGQMLRPNDTCEYCNCGGAGGCVVCGKALDVTIAIAPGVAHTWEWAGAHWSLRPFSRLPAMNLECEQPEAVAAGPVQVRVSYSLSKEDVPPESRIGPALFLSLDFLHPPMGELVLVAR